MTSLLFVVSEGASVDRNSNALSIFNMMEEINPVGLPLIIPTLVVIQVVEREDSDPDELRGHLTITNNERSPNGFPSDILFHGNRRARLTVRINGLPVHEAGTLVFRYTAGAFLDCQLTLVVSEPKSTGDS
jgi:hypothetical protein